MKTLLLLRHGKSSWDNPSLADFERPLTPRGIKAAKRMGRELAARDWIPGLALVSPAVRTQQTWELLASGLQEQPQAVSVETLYDATPDEVLAEINQASEAAGILLVVGHNPSLQDLAVALVDAKSDEKALDRLQEKFPTGALARFVFEGAWKNLSNARLTHCLRPRELS